MGYRKTIEDEIFKLVKKWKPEAKAYTVGGCVRDELLKETIKDFDVVVDCPGSDNPAIEFVDFLKANATNTKDFATYPRFGTARFTLKLPTREEVIECVMPRKEHYHDGPRKPSDVEKTTIAEDASRRDFCCNALYKDLETGEILDPTGRGLKDLEQKILRTPLDPEETFKDDPLRMLRAIRFACKKDFTISKETKEAIKPIPEYYELSMERVRDEFLKIISSRKAKEGVWLLHETGLLKYIIPELEEAWGFNQNSKYHSMNLTDHILEVLNKCVGNSHHYGDESLPMAALLHDISKYRDHQLKPDGTFSFHGHEAKSADMARDILTRLKCSGKFIDRVDALIRNHMIIKSQYDYDTAEYTGSDKQILKIVNKFQDDGSTLINDLLTLIDADNLSHAPKYCMPGQVSSFISRWAGLRGSGITRRTQSVPVSGDDIISKYNVKPGKRVGAIKDALTELWYSISVEGKERQDITKEDLFAAYEGEFKDRKIWVWKINSYDDDPVASIVEPTRNPVSLKWDVEDYTDRLTLDECEKNLADPDYKNLVILDAMMYPDIYLRCRTHKKSMELIGKIADLMEEFHKMPKFKEVVISLDDGNDLSARVDWHGHRSDYII